MAEERGGGAVWRRRSGGGGVSCGRGKGKVCGRKARASACMSKKRREGGGGGNGGCDPPVTDALSMDSGLREVSLSVVFSVWCLLLLRSQCHGSINVMSPWRLIDLFFVDFYDDVEDGMRENYCKQETDHRSLEPFNNTTGSKSSTDAALDELDEFRSRILQGKAANGRIPDGAAAHRLEPSGAEYNYAAASKGAPRCSPTIARPRAPPTSSAPRSSAASAASSPPLPHSSAATLLRHLRSSAATQLRRLRRRPRRRTRLTSLTAHADRPSLRSSSPCEREKSERENRERARSV
uniref:Uncharacterized protein n=1 Tax=Oryza sativa subsp. japonica TaxID=39947 RepID=Q5Z6F7_ORYSJ|nr:hypothetical protein [Oryza sativa Japonica Group]